MDSKASIQPALCPSRRSCKARAVAVARGSVGFQFRTKYRYIASDHHDRRVTADVLYGIVEDDVAVLDPAVGGKGPRLNTEHPVGVNTVAGQIFEECERIV